ncbi:tetratricopeptide repeat protein [Undibacterium sp. TJN19]|uniref:tetratricopeptide repeat protein n=1 Tax=Undibacterium sp. TJN19 TaxID=3413055 RepID=UPI003BF3113C
MLNKYKMTALLIAAATLNACAPAPTTAEIESAGMQALHGQNKSAIAALQKWASAGNTIAQRELGLAYSVNPQNYALASVWLEKAAIAGDADAQFQLAEAHYKARLDLSQNYQLAWKWYEAAARNKNARASFMLARMAKYGQGVPQDIALSMTWLKTASEQGNAQAMFLLSNAYAAGEGVAQDPALARKWLEESAELEYPVAIQALAMELESGSKQVEKDPARARHLIKEASDERLLRWNKYQ